MRSEQEIKQRIKTIKYIINQTDRDDSYWAIERNRLFELEWVLDEKK